MDSLIRLAAFNWLEERTIQYEDGVLPRKVLEQGFVYKAERITLIGPKGIWKPRQMDLPISITTVYGGPYDDALPEKGFLQYRYRGTDPNHSDNLMMKELDLRKIPLIYFFGLEEGKYLPMWPVFVEGAYDEALTFDVSVDEASALTFNIADDAAAHGRREYITTLMKQRVHQQAFREKVMRAYNSTCTLCKLRHRELLDAAHIISDKEPDGLPVIKNGLALCKIHHAAFDKNIIGIDPDYTVHIQEEVLLEIDGPMLKYGLQSLDKQKLILPTRKKDWPEQERLERRYQGFLKAS